VELLSKKPKRPRNRILLSLRHAERDRLMADLELVGLDIREIVYDVDTRIDHVYFVETGVLSIVGVTADGSSVETATVGREGMLGLPVFLDSDRSSTQAFCQVAGESLRMTADAFRRAAAASGDLRLMLHRYTQALFTQVAQTSACNRLHPVRQRCARWLLQTHDRMDTPEFPLTHDFLSQMLGVRRASVTEVAGVLQREGLIEYAHGRITIKNRRGLERTSCECYAIVQAEFDRLLDGRKTASPLDGIKASKDGKSVLNNGTPRKGR